MNFFLLVQKVEDVRLSHSNSRAWHMPQQRLIMVLNNLSFKKFRHCQKKRSKIALKFNQKLEILDHMSRQLDKWLNALQQNLKLNISRRYTQKAIFSDIFTSNWDLKRNSMNWCFFFPLICLLIELRNCCRSQTTM